MYICCLRTQPLASYDYFLTQGIERKKFSHIYSLSLERSPYPRSILDACVTSHQVFYIQPGQGYVKLVIGFKNIISGPRIKNQHNPGAIQRCLCHLTPGLNRGGAMLRLKPSKTILGFIFVVEVSLDWRLRLIWKAGTSGCLAALVSSSLRGQPHV